jgi:recombinational DNA repair protein RecR
MLQRQACLEVEVEEELVPADLEALEDNNNNHNSHHRLPSAVDSVRAPLVHSLAINQMLPTSRTTTIILLVVANSPNTEDETNKIYSFHFSNFIFLLFFKFLFFVILI